MIRRVIISFIFIFLSSISNAWATASRMETMGEQRLYMMDGVNIYTNPATAAYYRNCVAIHMGGIDGGDVSATGVIIWRITDPLTLAFSAGGPVRLTMVAQGNIYSIKMDSIVNGAFADHFGILPGNPPNDMSITWMNPADLILSYKMGKVIFGASYMLVNGMRNEKDKIAKIEEDEAAVLHGVQFGVSAKMKKIQPEAWFHWDPYWIRSTYADESKDYKSEEKLRGDRFNMGGRVFYGISETVTVVPAVNWEHVTGAVTIDTHPDLTISFPGHTTTFSEHDLGQNYTVDSLQTGMGVQYRTGQPLGLLVAVSAGLQWSRWIRELDIDKTPYNNLLKKKNLAAPNFALGIEYWTNKVLCVRGGISTTTMLATSLETQDNKDISGKKTENNSTIDTIQTTKAAVGVRLRFGKLLVDGTFGNFFLVGEDGDTGGKGPNLFSHLDFEVKL